MNDDPFPPPPKIERWAMRLLIDCYLALARLRLRSLENQAERLLNERRRSDYEGEGEPGPMDRRLALLGAEHEQQYHQIAEMKEIRREYE